MSLFVTIEGGEFTGKSSVATWGLKQFLKNAGFDTLVSREPGGTKKAEAIRKEIFSKLGKASALELAHLFNKARRIHLDEVISPFFNAYPKGIALLDRYCDSTFVYQTIEGADLKDLLKLHKEYTQNRFPDLTFIMYIPEERMEKILQQRRASKDLTGIRDRNHNDDLPIHKHVTMQRTYLGLENSLKKHSIHRSFITIDASQHPHDVIKNIVTAFAKHFPQQFESIDIQKSLSKVSQHKKWKSLDKIWRTQQSSIPHS